MTSERRDAGDYARFNEVTEEILICALNDPATDPEFLKETCSRVVDYCVPLRAETLDLVRQHMKAYKGDDKYHFLSLLSLPLHCERPFRGFDAHYAEALPYIPERWLSLSRRYLTKVQQAWQYFPYNP